MQHLKLGPIQSLVKRQFLPTTPTFKRFLYDGPTTLDPARLSPREYVDLSTLINPAIFHVGRRFSWDRGRITPFPDKSKGFCYYRASEYPRDPGEIRLRLSTSGDPQWFANEVDLKHPEGYPWCIKLPTIASGRTFGPLRKQLIKEGLVSEDEMNRCAKIGVVRAGPFQLYSLEQPFYMKMEVGAMIRIYIGEQEHCVRLYNIIHDSRRRAGGRLVGLPYTGSIMARFERAPTAPNTFHIRVLDVLQPIKPVSEDYDGYMHKPEVGKLMSKGLGHRPSRLLRLSSLGGRRLVRLLTELGNA